jgi:hypothetical protein
MSKAWFLFPSWILETRDHEAQLYRHPRSQAQPGNERRPARAALHPLEVVWRWEQIPGVP